LRFIGVPCFNSVGVDVDAAQTLWRENSMGFSWRHSLRIVVAAGALIAPVGAAILMSSSASAQDVARGDMVFETNCAVCHGAAASGRMGPPLNMVPPEISSMPPDAIAMQLTGLVRNGIPGAMPSFVPAQLSDQDVVDLVAYLLANNEVLPRPHFYEALERVAPDPTGARTFFPETGHSVGGEFRDFFVANGGVPILGFPLSEEYWSVASETGRTLRMQLFERVRLVLDPDAPPGARVQLGALGAEELRLRTHFLEE
jgi:mono/diheme cytochrome c family protein